MVAQASAARDPSIFCLLHNTDLRESCWEECLCIGPREGDNSCLLLETHV